MSDIVGLSFNDVKTKVVEALGAAEALLAFANEFDSIIPTPYVTVLEDVQKILSGLQTVVDKA